MKNEQNSAINSLENTPLTSNSTQIGLNERAELVLNGELTLAESIGISRPQLYEIAKQAFHLFESGKLEEARNIYKGLVAADPYDSVFHCHLGAVQLQLGNSDEAFEQFNLALQYNIANVDAFAGRGEVNLSRGDLNEAVADLSKAIELDPQGERVSSRRARAALVALKNKLEQQTANNNQQ